MNNNIICPFCRIICVYFKYQQLNIKFLNFETKKKNGTKIFRRNHSFDLRVVVFYSMTEYFLHIIRCTLMHMYLLSFKPLDTSPPPSLSATNIHVEIIVSCLIYIFRHWSGYLYYVLRDRNLCSGTERVVFFSFRVAPSDIGILSLFFNF